jgi:hypothetical protein
MSTEPMDTTPQELDPLRRLRKAVHSASAPPELSVKIRQRLDAESEQRATFWFGLPWVPITAALAVCFGISVAYQLGHLRFTVGQQESFMASALTKVSYAMKPGLDDHLHCSVYGRIPKVIPPLADAVKDLPPQFAALLTIVQDKAPRPFQLYSAHQCTRHGRKFIHFQLKSESKLLSVIVTRRNVDESFVRDHIVPALAVQGTNVYQSHAVRFQMAAIESRDFIAYVVSDLSSDENRAIMLAMAPELHAALRKIEG